MLLQDTDRPVAGDTWRPDQPQRPHEPVPRWAIGGARRLSAEGVRLAERAALALLEDGARLAVGCCTGTDAAVLHAAAVAEVAERLLVCCAFGRVGECTGAAAALTPGTCRWSAPAAVALAEAAGAEVRAWCGGGARVPLAARLHRRTLAVAAAASAGALVLLPPRSGGTLLLARSVAARGLPVLALPWRCKPAALPALDDTGRWSTAGAGPVPGALRWEPAQVALL